MDDNPGDEFSDLVDWFANDTVDFVGAGGNNNNSGQGQPSLSSQEYVTHEHSHQPHSDTSASRLSIGSSTRMIQPGTTRGRSQDGVRGELGSDHVENTPFLPFPPNPAPRPAGATTRYQQLLREAQDTARPSSMAQMPPPAVPRGVRRGAPEFEPTCNIPPLSLTPHGGVPGVAGHYARAAPHSSFTYTGNVVQPSTYLGDSQYDTHGLPSFLEDTSGFLQDWTGAQHARTRTGRMPPSLVYASEMGIDEAGDALVSLQQANQEPARQSSSASTVRSVHGNTPGFLPGLHNQQFMPTNPHSSATSSSSRRPSVNHMRGRHPPVRSVDDAQSGDTGYTFQPYGAFNQYAAPNPAVSSFNDNPYMSRTLSNTHMEGAFVRPSRDNTSRLPTLAPFVPGRHRSYSTHREPSSGNPYEHLQDQQDASDSLPGPTAGDTPFQIYEDPIDRVFVSQGQSSGDVQQREEPASPAPPREQRIVTDYMEYLAPVTLYEIVPETTGCQHAQAWLRNTTSDPRPSPTLIPDDVPEPPIATRFYHSTEGFIPSGNATSLLVLHNATNPWLTSTSAQGRHTTTIGTYGYHWFRDDWIHWVTFAPSLETWLALVEAKGYIKKVREWRPDMQPRDKRFHKAYWVAANRRALGGLLRRATLEDSTADPNAGEDEAWPTVTVDDLDSDCGHVGVEDRNDAWDVVMGVAEGIGAMNLDHIVCGDPEKPLYEQLLRIDRLKNLRE